MKIATILAAIAGLVLGTAIIGYFGFGEVLSALGAIGWGGFAIILVYQLGLYLLLGGCWWAIAPSPRDRFRAYVWGRLVRDSGSEVLPLSQIGGFVMGARAASLLGPPASIAIATTIVDVTIEVLAQLGYTVLGLALLVRVQPQAALIYPFAVGIAIGIVAILGFILLQRRGAALVEKFSQRLAASWLPGAASHARPLLDAIDAVYAHRGALASGFLLHLAGWIASAIEAWIALRLMGVDLGIAAVLTIESLLYAVRSVAFAVPNAVGVQEGAYVMLGGLFGLSPETALALSLLKRGRDITIGVPVLLVWQALEGGSLLRRRAPRGKGAP
ncbi:MAG TPA: lysylphosphatidylglycerol synthase domain-containing protein [Stellaceae bacterium]|jgi:putative membrane protein|nr:lysylphosphatidylglycerol synthase domain-containing protein [Stellaceae bacterium]